MAPIISVADLAICHMETPIAPTPADVSGYPLFGAPAELAGAVHATGYDGCSTASNHSLDKGPLPSGAPWATNLIDAARIHADASRARQAGAALVVVSVHWGTEYSAGADALQEVVAGDLLPSEDIDLVIGHHAHVVQPVRKIGATYVVFGLGNELSNQSDPPRRDGLTVVAIASPSFGRWRFTGLEVVPTWVDLAAGHRVLPVVRTLADSATSPALAADLRASYERTVATVTSGGAPGLEVPPLP
jgi:poly-gamma-glutamate synthesis protein (capsule biosynthesis protein)